MFKTFQIPDPKTHIFESLLAILWVESSIILCKLAQINKIFNFVIFVAKKKVVPGTANFFHPSILLLFLDPRSGMDKNQDPG